MAARNDIRLALPSKGRLEQETLDFLAACGLRVDKPNPRQYQASVPAIPGLSVIFQRPGDIVVGVRQGSLDFGIAGTDLIEENRGEGDDVVYVHDSLGYGQCQLALAVPEEIAVGDTAELKTWADRIAAEKKKLRIATKFPVLTGRFLSGRGIENAALISSEGTLEVAPAVGFADMICDLVSTGTTLRDNHLRPLADGTLIRSQSCLIANRDSLRSRAEVLAVARTLLEYIEAHLRGQEHCLVFANIRAASPEEIGRKLFNETSLGGLQGPTVSPVVARRSDGQNWYAIDIVVRKADVMRAVQELRSIGGSGVVVSPVLYIFEEEPERFLKLQQRLQS